MSDEDMAVEGVTRSESDEAREEPISYVSTRKRSFFAYKSDDASLLWFHGVLLEIFQQPEATRPFYFLCDMSIPCPFCKENLNPTEIYNAPPRKAALHTLYHGTIPISVVDLVCPQCNRHVPFDGACQELFSIAKSHILTSIVRDTNGFASPGTLLGRSWSGLPTAAPVDGGTETELPVHTIGASRVTLDCANIHDPDTLWSSFALSFRRSNGPKGHVTLNIPLVSFGPTFDHVAISAIVNDAMEDILDSQDHL